MLALVVCFAWIGPASAAPRLVPKSDIYNPPPVSSTPVEFTQVGTKFFFTAATLETGRELWITDGTAAGTLLVKDLTAGTGSTLIRAMIAFKGQLYFIANDALWRSTGTAAGTVLVKTLPPSVGYRVLTNAGSLLYIASAGGYSAPAELWVSDGTAARTLRVRTFWQPLEHTFGDNGKLYFVTREDTLLGRQLWTSDGTLFGTRVLAPGITCPTGVGCSNAKFFRVGTKVLVLVNTAWHYSDAHLWQTDGTTAGTQLIRAKAGALLAASSTAAYLGAGQTLTKTDGTAAGTLTVAKVSGAMSQAALAGSKLFMQTAAPRYDERELWMSSGTAAGTVLVKSLGESSYAYSDTAVASPSRYFFQKATSTGVELWSSDGTAAGTGLVKAFFRAANDPYAPAPMTSMAAAGNYILFGAATATEGHELWRSDGTPAGTQMIKNIAAEALTGEITGTVRDSVSGAAIAGATVQLVYSSNVPVTAVTGADGTYRIDRLTTDKYYLRVTSPAGITTLYPATECSGCTGKTPEPVQVTGGYVTSGVDFSVRAGARFRGRVTNDTGNPVAEVRISIVDANLRQLASGVTAADGTYITSPGLPEGTYYAVADPAFGTSYTRSIYGYGACYNDPYVYAIQCKATIGTALTAAPPTTTPGIDFRLSTLPRISGHVVDVHRLPIRGVPVTIYNESGIVNHHTVTDSTGAYLSRPLGPGRYFATADGSGTNYVSQTWHNQVCAPACDVLSGRAIDVFFDAGSDGVDFMLSSRAGRIKGTITDSVTGAAVSVPVRLYDAAGAEVMDVGAPRYQHPPMSTGGVFELRNLPPGTYYLRTGKQLYEGIPCADVACAVTSGKPIVITDAESAVQVAVAYAHDVTVSGRILDAKTGLPVYNASARWIATDGTEGGGIMAGSDGTWTLHKPKVPSYLVFRGDGHVSEAYDDKLLTCTNVGVDCSVPEGTLVFDPGSMTTDRTGIDATLVAQGRIQGVVHDTSGRPLSNQDVYLYNASGSYYNWTRTDAAGAYVFSAGHAAPHYVAAGSTSGNYARQLYQNIACPDQCNITSGTPLNPAPGTTATANFVLQLRTGGVAGTVVDDLTGRPLHGVTVAASVNNSSYSSLVATTGPDGRFELIGLSPGSVYYFRATKPESEYLGQVFGGANCDADGTCNVTGGTAVTAQTNVLTTANFRLAKLAITSISPRSGPASGGTRVTVTGMNFASGMTVAVDGIAAVVSSLSPTEIVFVTPPGAIGNAHLSITSALKLIEADAFTYLGAAAGDVNGDFRSDVLWRNPSTGVTEAWLMDGRFAPATTVYAKVAAAWEPQTLGDFDGDGLSDVFWRNTSTGQTSVWYMRAGTPRYVNTTTQALSWQLIGSGDFDLDGNADLFWRNEGAGTTQIWFGGTSSFRITASTAAVAAWQAQAVGDVSGDGRADVIWRNTGTGQVAAWVMNGATPTVRNVAKTSAGWRVAGTGDTDGDGVADIVWRNDSTGEQVLWLMSSGGGTFSGRALVRVSDVSWKPVGIRDTTGDGRADIVWRNTASGAMSLWVMNGPVIASTVMLPQRTTDWQPYMSR